MIEKVVCVQSLHSSNQVKEDLEYWLSKSPEERLSAVEILRRQFHGTDGRIQKVAHVINRTSLK
jgi:hypothetical protein